MSRRDLRATIGSRMDAHPIARAFRRWQQSHAPRRVDSAWFAVTLQSIHHRSAPIVPSSGSPSPRVDAAAGGLDAARWLTPAVAVLVVYAIAFPRSATTIFLVPVVAGIAVLATQYRNAGLRLSLNGLLIALLAFAAWSVVSATWSVAPMA